MDKTEEKIRAAALRYTPGEMAAPRVVAAGEGDVARAIIRAARESGVPVRADPLLAASLRAADIGREIPPELYRAAAEVLAFVYTLPGRQAKGNIWQGAGG